MIGQYDPSTERNLIGDVDRIQQVLLNLASNAAKFAPRSGGKIEIKAKLLIQRSLATLHVKVANNGPGISE